MRRGVEEKNNNGTTNSNLSLSYIYRGVSDMG